MKDNKDFQIEANMNHNLYFHEDSGQTENFS